MLKNGKLISILFVLGVVCSLAAVSSVNADQSATPNKAIVSLTNTFDNSVIIFDQVKNGNDYKTVNSWTFNKGDVASKEFEKDHFITFKINIKGYDSTFGPCPASDGIILKTFLDKDSYGWVSVTIANETVNKKTGGKVI